MATVDTSTTGLSQLSGKASTLLNSSTATTSTDSNRSILTDESGDLSVQVDSLPNLTVQEFLETLCHELEGHIRSRAESQKKRILEEFEQGKQELLEYAKRLRTGAAKSATPVLLVKVEIIGGKGAPKKKTLKVGGVKNIRAPVGRSAGIKFVEKGVSLSWDDTVSTTHGQFSMVSGELQYEDWASTNGSSIIHAGKPNEPVEVGRFCQAQAGRLKKGDTVLVGKCKIKILDIDEEA